MKFVVPLVFYLATCCYAAPFVLPRAFTSNLPQVANTTADNGTALEAPASVWPAAGQASSSFLGSLASFLPFQQQQSFPAWQGLNQFPNAAQISEATSIPLPALTAAQQNSSQSDAETEINQLNPVEFRSMPQQFLQMPQSFPQFNAAPSQFSLPQFMPYGPQSMPNAAYSMPDSIPNPFSYPQPYTYPYSPFFNFKPQELPKSSLSQMEVPLVPSMSTLPSLPFQNVKNGDQLTGVNWPLQGFPFQSVMPQNQFWPSRGQATFPSVNMNFQAGTQPFPQMASMQNPLLPQLANSQNSLMPKFANAQNSQFPQFVSAQNSPIPQLANVPNSPFASTLPANFLQGLNFKPNPFQANLFPSQPVTAKPVTVQNAPSSPGFLSALFGQQASAK